VSDTQARLDATRERAQRRFDRTGDATERALAVDLLRAVDALTEANAHREHLLAELERVTAALREAKEQTYCQICGAALAGAARAAQEDGR
jgi:molecular chaperone GrpE (heat shock protein)